MFSWAITRIIALNILVYLSNADYEETRQRDIDLKRLSQENQELSQELSYYDVNKDGLLDEEEAEINNVEIHQIFDKYLKKHISEQMQRANNVKDDQSNDKTHSNEEQQQSKSSTSDTGSFVSPALVWITVLLGGAIFIIYLLYNYFIMKKTKDDKHKEQKLPNSARREEWLNRISQKNQEQRSNVKGEGLNDQNQATKSEQTCQISKSIAIKADGVCASSQIKEKESVKKEESSLLKTDVTDVKNEESLNQSSDQNVEISESISAKPDEWLKRRQNVEEEETTDSLAKKHLTLQQFLEESLNCKIEVKKSKTHYSLGSLTVNTDDWPNKPDDVPISLSTIFKLILPRQLNKINYVLNCFDVCESNTPYNIQNEITKTASDWLKLKTADTIFGIVSVGGKIGSTEDDLWSEYSSSDNVNESIDFLRRVGGWSKDGVLVSSTMLTHLLNYSIHGDKSSLFLSTLLHAAGKQLHKVKRIDEMVLQEMNTLKGLEILLSNVNISHVLSVILQTEVDSAQNDLGIFFERESILGPLLSVTTVPSPKKTGTMMALTGSSVIPFLELQRKSSQIQDSDLKILEKSIQDGYHQCQQCLYTALKKVISNKSYREVGLSWLTAVIGLNDLRTASLLITDAQTQSCCSDGFMLNFCGIMLKFFTPIYGNVDKMKKIELNYTISPACRLNYDFETCLASGQIVYEKEKKFGALPADLQTQHNFITECYHLTQRTLSVGLIPSLIHYNHMHREFTAKLQALKGTSDEKQIKDMHMLLTLMWDTSLADPELIKNVTMFYLTQAQLLLDILQQNDSKDIRLTFQQVPEYCIKDMAEWFQFVAGHVIYIHKGILWGLSLSPFVDCCVMLLERPDLMPGPIVASKIVSSLLQFVQTTPNQNRGSDGWGSSTMSDLALMVHTSPTVQYKLGPALIHTYISVDVVEGLDVDKDEFDKYTSRARISQLIQHLWKRADCKEHILELHKTAEFQNFLGAILDTLLYMLHDSLSRMANVKRLEMAKDNEAEWNELSSKEQEDKTMFLLNEEKAGRGFMALANQTLDFILLLTEEDVVSSCFNIKPLSNRSASAICGFLLSLCGHKAKDYKVKNMAKYNFNPKILLTNIVKIILHICKNDGEEFVKALVEDSDFEVETFDKAFDIIYSKGLTHDEFINQFAELIVQMKELKSKRDFHSNKKTRELDWMKEGVEVEINSEEILKSYSEKMSPLRFGTANVFESHSYQSHVQSLDPRSPKVKYLMKEIKQLRESLPIHPNAAIYVRQDEDRMDIMRAMITGPVDTPYSLGCFIFDIYFPSSYPYNPPLVKLITTGNGTVRFNPNLYSDGKVCLSLLGTWHAGDASEKWNAGKSTLHQVLVSIQSMILTSDPMFNEPGYDGMRETEDGKSESLKYNWKIQLQTLRNAILANMKNPPPGFKQVILHHYKLQKNSVIKQCLNWINNCNEEDVIKRMRDVANDIHHHLKFIDNLDDCDMDDDDQDDDN